MPWYFLSWVLGSNIYLYQETLYRSKSCKRVHPAVLQGWPLEFVQHIFDDTPVPPSPPGPPGYCLLHLLHLFCHSFIIGMPNSYCILELRTNQCFVCNFLCMLRCKSQIAPKKTQCLSCFTRNFRNLLTPFQVTCISNKRSKVFGGSNLFQRLLM